MIKCIIYFSVQDLAVTLGCPLKGCIVTLRSSQGKYVEAASAGLLLVNAQEMTERAKWYISFQTVNEVNLKSKVSGKYLKADPNTGTLTHRPVSAGGWETFTVSDLSNGNYALETYHGKYLRIVSNVGLIGNGESIDQAEPFQINVCK